MNKITFLVASLFLVWNATQAQETERGRRPRMTRPDFYAIDYREATPIFFLEKGIEFYVFPTGDFDFNALPLEPPRHTTHENYGYSNYDIGRPRGIRIEHDNYGRVKRVGNVFINYDYFGRVKRIGSVFMSYNSFALTRIGGMRIFYNHHGQIIGVRGFVNGFSSYPYYPCPNGYNGGTNYGNQTYENEDDFYYYKKDGTKEKMNKDDIDAIKKDAIENKG